MRPWHVIKPWKEKQQTGGSKGKPTSLVALGASFQSLVCAYEKVSQYSIWGCGAMAARPRSPGMGGCGFDSRRPYAYREDLRTSNQVHTPGSEQRHTGARPFGFTGKLKGSYGGPLAPPEGIAICGVQFLYLYHKSFSYHCFRLVRRETTRNITAFCWEGIFFDTHTPKNAYWNLVRRNQRTRSIAGDLCHDLDISKS